jgi:hypothetical protein
LTLWQEDPVWNGDRALQDVTNGVMYGTAVAFAGLFNADLVCRIFKREVVRPDKLCKNCRSEVKPADNYCQHCGAKISGWWWD